VGTVSSVAFFLIYGSSLVAVFQVAAQAGAQGGQPDPEAVTRAMLPMMASIWMFQLMALGASLADSAYFVTKFGATPGKMAVGIRIIRADGGPVQVGQAIGRYFAHLLSGFILYIGYMMAGWDEEKRALHDRIVETRVVYKQS
jgi:uncharacterized RDD family membrane protein YckC